MAPRALPLATAMILKCQSEKWRGTGSTAPPLPPMHGLRPCMHGARLEVPGYTKGKNHLSREDVERTRYFACVRIHNERVIGLIKNKYKHHQE